VQRKIKLAIEVRMECYRRATSPARGSLANLTAISATISGEFALAVRQRAERMGNIDQHQGKLSAVEPSDPMAKGTASQHEPYANAHPS